MPPTIVPGDRVVTFAHSMMSHDMPVGMVRAMVLIVVMMSAGLRRR
jgi:hypothetical protein